MESREQQLRQAIIEQCLEMNASGLNQGTSGNISVRDHETLLITPSGIPYLRLQVQDIACISLTGSRGEWVGPYAPSTEWPMHVDIMQARPEVGAIVHTHSTFATILAISQREIPAVHYMIAAFGGGTVRCADYATFGTDALSHNALNALEDREACLLANHGMLTLGRTLEQAMWRAVELETLARQYYHCLLLDGGKILPNEEIFEVIKRFAHYGPKTEP